MKIRILSLACLFALLLPALAGADYQPFDLPENLTAIGEKAFYNTPGRYHLILPNGIESIGSEAFGETNIQILEFPQKSLGRDTVHPYAFAWDQVSTVYVYKGDAQNSDRTEDLYDFIAELKSKWNYGFEIIRTDRHVIASANTELAFLNDTEEASPKGTFIQLTASHNLSSLSVKGYQWQESQDGETGWTDCTGGEQDETAEDRIYSFYAYEGMPRYYRCVVTLKDEKEGQLISENTVCVELLAADVVQLSLQAQVSDTVGTSVNLGWTLPEKLAGLACSVYKQTEDADSPDEDGNRIYTALELVESGITGEECRIDLLQAETNFQFFVGVETPDKDGAVFCTLDDTPQQVTTGYGPGADEVAYRALLIGEVNFPGDICNRNWGDVKRMREMLRQAKGASRSDGTGGDYGVVVKKDLSAEGILSAIDEVLGSADSNDVSLLFIATHGDTDTAKDEESESGYKTAGSLCTIEYSEQTGSTEWGDLYLQQLADKLSSVEGEVNIFLGSCGSGAAVISDEGAEAIDEEKRQAEEAFASAAVQAFAQAAEAAELDARVGELRNENQKFHVLTAARYRQSSWGWEGADPHNVFTQHLIDGVLESAAVNDAGQVTLGALYEYIQEVGDKEEHYDKNVLDEEGEPKAQYQNVQVWPQKDMDGYTDPLFVRGE